MSWDTLNSQKHHDSNHLTLSERKNENCQRTEKSKYKCLLTFTQDFLLILGS